LASDSQSWVPIVKELATHYTVITFDNRGVGRTKPLNIKVSIQEITEDCVALIQHLGWSSVNLLGHSMGGFVALDCAIRHPEFISKLILVGTSAFNSKRNNALFSDWASYLKMRMDPYLWFKNIFYWIFSERFFENKEAADQALRGAVAYPYPQTADAFQNQVCAIESFNCLDKLSLIQSEAQIICGKEDLLFPPEASIQVLQAIPNARFCILEYAAHSVHMEQPLEFIDCILNFMEN
jgi:pimeloyl-ACP methyl ester carboxylesterase